LKADFLTESQEKVAALRPIMDYLHGRILVYQKQMVDVWIEFSTKRQEAEAEVVASVADIS